MSDNIALAIRDEIKRGYDFVVEYGMGASTLYFARAHTGTFVSIENTYKWFEICKRYLSKEYEVSQEWARLWTHKEIEDFVSAPHEGTQRLAIWQESMRMGPLFRFSPNAKSRLSGKLGPLFPILKPLFSLVPTRPIEASCTMKGDATLILRNIPPAIKDQFGEAPNMHAYINAGLSLIRQHIKKAPARCLFIIDGGPRHYILNEIFSLENHKNFMPKVFLCDAHRPEYESVLSKRNGQYIRGSGEALNGEIIEGDATKEAWVYG